MFLMNRNLFLCFKTVVKQFHSFALQFPGLWIIWRASKFYPDTTWILTNHNWLINRSSPKASKYCASSQLNTKDFTETPNRIYGITTLSSGQIHRNSAVETPNRIYNHYIIRRNPGVWKTLKPRVHESVSSEAPSAQNEKIFRSLHRMTSWLALVCIGEII